MSTQEYVKLWLEDNETRLKLIMSDGDGSRELAKMLLELAECLAQPTPLNKDKENNNE